MPELEGLISGFGIAASRGLGRLPIAGSLPPVPTPPPHPKIRHRRRSWTAGLLPVQPAYLAHSTESAPAGIRDMVAARAKAGKATVYRRWTSKAELVRDALIYMSRSSVDLDRLPDTGSLRGDLLAVMTPYSKDFGEKKLRVIAGLGSFFTEHRKLAEEATSGIFERWMAVNRALMSRAIDRAELAPKPTSTWPSRSSSP